MSWLVSSIANSLKLDDDDDDFDPQTTNSATDSTTSTTGTGAGKDRPSLAANQNDNDNPQMEDSSSDEDAPRRGVKEDLSELSQTLTRQFWGVASFLAPPPQISDRDCPSDDSVDPAGISGIRSDLSEIGGKFRTGISKLSGNKAVSEFTKIASNFLQFGMEDLTVEDYAQRGVVGVTEEVVAFARDIALHPETWLDFPLPDDEDEEDFDLSDAQQEHALAVERLVPELAALRSELCLGYMSEASFWKIYFVLVHQRLSKHDALILSTPEIVKARAMLSQELRSCSAKSMQYGSGGTNSSVDTTRLSHEEHLSVPVIDQSESVPVEISAVEPASSVGADLEMDKHPVTCTEIPVVEKIVTEEVSSKQTNMEEVSTKRVNSEEVSTKKTNLEDVSTKQTNIEEVSAKKMDMEYISTKQTNTQEVLTQQTNVQKPTSCTSKSAEQNDDDDADDWLKEEHTEAGDFKGNSYPVGNDDDDITFSDLEEDD